MLRQQSNLVTSKYLTGFLHYRPFCLKHMFPTDYSKDLAPNSNIPTIFLKILHIFQDCLSGLHTNCYKTQICTAAV